MNQNQPNTNQQAKDPNQRYEDARAQFCGILSRRLAASLQTEGIWLNPGWKQAPRNILDGVDGHLFTISPFYSLVLAAASDERCFNTNIYGTYNDWEALKVFVQKGEKSVPIMRPGRWSDYKLKTNPAIVITEKDYNQLPAQDRELYNRVKKDEIYRMFNLDQSKMQTADNAQYAQLKESEGFRYIDTEDLQTSKSYRSQLNAWIKAINQNMVPIKRSPDKITRYDEKADVVYFGNQDTYSSFQSFAQDVLRAVALATANPQRQSRNKITEEDMLAFDPAGKNESLVAEFVSAYMMLKLGMPAQIQEKYRRPLSNSGRTVLEIWANEVAQGELEAEKMTRNAVTGNLEQVPLKMTAFEARINNAVNMIERAITGHKIAKVQDLQSDEINKFRRRGEFISSEALLELGHIFARKGLVECDEYSLKLMEEVGLRETAMKVSDCYKAWTDESKTESKAVIFSELKARSNILMDKVSQIIYENESNLQDNEHNLAWEITNMACENHQDFVLVLDKENSTADIISFQGVDNKEMPHSSLRIEDVVKKTMRALAMYDTLAISMAYFTNMSRMTLSFKAKR